MGVLTTFKNSVTLVNRTIGAGEYECNLNVRYDGEDIQLRPGENVGFPAEAVGFAKRQNILMGTRHPLDPHKFVSLVGVKDVDSEADTKPIPKAVLAKAALKLEAVDREGEVWDEPMERQVGDRPGQIKLRRKNPFSAYEAQVSIPMDVAPGDLQAQ